MTFSALRLISSIYSINVRTLLCGPEFTPDGKTLFLAIQHPAEEAGSTYDKPSTRWPDFKPGVPPRSAVLAVTREDGGEIGA